MSEKDFEKFGKRFALLCAVDVMCAVVCVRAFFDNFWLGLCIYILLTLGSEIVLRFRWRIKDLKEEYLKDGGKNGNSNDDGCSHDSRD